MKKKILRPILILLLISGTGSAGLLGQRKAVPGDYLDSLRMEMEKAWPDNRTINLVFHGHSVPSGYLVSPEVKTLEAYPHLTLKKIKEAYPHAVVNVITTAIGGEHSEQGAARFNQEVLCHRPDLLFIDYGLNDRRIGIDRAKSAWRSMISQATSQGIPVILLTPTPDLNEDIMDPASPLASFSRLIRILSVEHGVGLVDSYTLFRKLAAREPLEDYMSQYNHINEAGHMLVAELIFMWLEP